MVYLGDVYAYIYFITETEAKGTPDVLSFLEVQHRLQSPLSEFVKPSHSQTLCLWGEEATYNHVELDYGGPIRLKTKGNSPFIGDTIHSIQIYTTTI